MSFRIKRLRDKASGYWTQNVGTLNKAIEIAEIFFDLKSCLR